MKEIVLSQGKVALVDNDDFEYLNQWKWYAWCSRGHFYAVRSIYINGKKSNIHLHRLIMKTPIGMEVDHKDMNGLNCQKYNMRNCTHRQNMCNRKSTGSSKYLGVYFQKKYIRATITVNRKVIYLGLYKKEIDAAIAYNEAAIKYHGEFANINVV